MVNKMETSVQFYEEWNNGCILIYNEWERIVLVSIVREKCIRTREKERTGFVYRLMVKQSKAKEGTLELHGCIKVVQ